MTDPLSKVDTSSIEMAPFGEGSIVIRPAANQWIRPLLEKVSELGSLPPNWNSYGAQAIHPEIAETAITLLVKLLTPDDPVPAVVPTSRGGIMLEWHEGGIDLEIDIRSPSSFHVTLTDGEFEGEYQYADFRLIEEKLDLLRKRLR